MGLSSLFTSKIFAGVLAGGFTLAGAGLLFTGTDKLHEASDFVKDAQNRLVQFENNEGSLLAKLHVLKTDANVTIDGKNQSITELTGQKTALQDEAVKLNATISGLNGDVTKLQADLATEQGNHAQTQAQLDAKIAELQTANAKLQTANAKITELNGYLQYALDKSKEGDVLVKQLEGEVQKANAEVDALSKDVDTAKTGSSNAQPLTQDEVDAVDTSIHQ